MAFRNGMVRLHVTIPQSDRPLTFLLDSGAGASVIDATTAQRLGLKFGRSEAVQGVHTRGVARRVKIAGTTGGVPVPASMLALDLRAVSAATGCQVDGLLGFDFFRSRVVQIDYAAGMVRILSRGELAAGGVVLPLSARNGALMVEAGVGENHAARLRVDTGCSSAVEWAPGRPARAGGSNSIGVLAAGGKSSLLDVRLGSLPCGAVPVGLHARQIFPGEDGLLGNGLLSRFTVTIDAVKKRLILSER